VETSPPFWNLGKTSRDSLRSGSADEVAAGNGIVPEFQVQDPSCLELVAIKQDGINRLRFTSGFANKLPNSTGRGRRQGSGLKSPECWAGLQMMAPPESPAYGQQMSHVLAASQTQPMMGGTVV